VLFALTRSGGQDVRAPKEKSRGEGNSAAFVYVGVRSPTVREGL